MGFRVLGFRVQDLSWVLASSDYCCSWNCAGTLTQWILWCWILHENDNHCVIAYVTKSRLANGLSPWRMSVIAMGKDVPGNKLDDSSVATPAYF